MGQRIAFIIFLFPTLLLGQLTCEDEFLLSGSANLQGECIEMTPNTTGQIGCAWFHELTDFSMPFTHDMTVSFGADNNGADGICLVYQNNDATICGISGEGIGAQGIPNSFIIEFDTYQNGNLGDPFNDHAGININGDFTNNIAGPIDLGNIEDGNQHDISFSWDPGTMTYEVYFDGVLIMSGVYDIINNCFGGDPFAYWGYTSSTGGETNQHLVCPGLPPEIFVDAGLSVEIPCAGAAVTLDGTASDNGPEFTYEWSTFDGNIVDGEFTLTPTVDAEGTYTLTIFNNNTLCEGMAEVEVTLGEIEALLDTPPYLDCISGQVVLSGAGSSSGPNITYQWSTPDGNIVDTNGDQATVDQAGEYTLTVIYDDGVGVCMEEATVLVEENPDVPVAFALDEVLSCDPPFVELDGTGSSESSVFTYLWTTSDGTILAGETSLFPLVGSAGMYTLVVTNSVSGCTDEYFVFVTEDQDPPDAIALVDDDLGCGGGTVTIDGSLSSFGDEFTYQWTSSNGNIVSGANEQSPVVDVAGEYTLVVTNTENGCTDQTTVTVEGGVNNVMANIAAPATLNCQTTAIQLDASSSVPDNGVIYNWSTMDGQIDSNATSLIVDVSAPGTYTLIIEDLDNGCADTTSVVVMEDVMPPVAEAGTAMPFGCSDVSQQLNGTGSSTVNTTYSWTTTNGTLLNGQTTLTPEVGGAGTYVLVVTNTQNGCTASDQVVVPADSDIPVVQIAQNDTLDCTLSSLVLDANGSSTGMNFSTTWSTANGNFVSGTDGLQPVIDAPGTYTLEIIDTGNGCSNDASITIVQDIIEPTAQLAMPDTLNCAVTSLTLDASGSSAGDNFAYSWSTADGIISGVTDTLLATAVAPGTYLFVVNNQQNGCQDSLAIVVAENILTPDISIANPAELNCTLSNTNLAATLNNAVPQINYQWSTANGSIVNGATGLQPEVDAPGTYQLISVNTESQCADTTSIMVSQDITPPVADAGPDELLNCFDTSQTLGGNSSTGGIFSYQWTSPDATIGGDNTQPTLATVQPGSFILAVTNTDNNCVATDTVIVSQDIAAPMASVAAPPLLTCTDSLALLDGSASSGNAALSFAWSTMNGSLVGDPTASQLNAGQAGTYQLIVTQQDNGCSDTTMVSVMQDDNFPTAMVAAAADLTCERLSVVLNASANSASGNTVFSWSTVDGNIIANGNTLQPEVDQAGTYTLTVEDGNNNCRAQAEVVVSLDDTPPLAAAGLDTLLNCDRLALQLDASASTQGSNITYTWLTSDGNIMSGDMGQAPTVNAAGTYSLEVVNTTNGCRASDEVLVSIDTIAPMPTIAMPTTITCAETAAILDASASISSGPASFSWTSPDGNTIEDANTAQATVNMSGTYNLLLIDTSNGCTNTASVTVDDDLTPPDPQIAAPELLTCTITSISLDASASTGNNLSYTWTTTDGQIDADGDTSAPVISAPGTYELLVLDGDNGCVNSTNVMVDSDTEPPLLSISDPQTVNCYNPQIGLQAFVGSNIGTAPDFQWISQDGNIVADGNTLTPTVDEAGMYVFTVTNTDNGCLSRDSVRVREDIEAPMVNFSLVETLDCNNGSVEVDAGTSSGNSGLTFSWTSPNGNITSPTDQPSITVDTPGDYGLLLTSTGNGCTDSLGLVVSQDTISPVVNIGDPAILDCSTPSLVLDAGGSDNAGVFVLNWSTTGGQIDAGADGLMPTVSQPGTYTLEISNTQNGCVSAASVVVNQDDEVPVIIFADPDILTCVVNSVTLDAGDSSVGNTLSYNWTTTNGQILAGEDSLMPDVGAPGVYELTIIDSSNGCSNSATLAVEQDIAPPLAEAGADFTLDCASDVDFLDGTGSSLGGVFTAQWTSFDGSIISGSTTLTPGINLPGTYQLLVTNTDNGCTATDQVLVIEDIPVGMVALEQPLCFGDDGSISFNGVQGGTPPYLYTIDGGASLQLQSAFFGVSPGVYTAQIEDVNGCLYEEMVEIEQPDSLVAIFTEPALEIKYGDSIRLHVQTNFPLEDLAEIIWDNPASLSCDDCLQPYASPTESGFYQVTVISVNGCRDEAVVRILVNREFPVYFPSAFSPDGDGANDLFYPFAQLGAVNKIHSFLIFDRWGNEVHIATNFQPNDPAYGWDGNQRGLPYNPGVFVYMAEVELADGRIEIFKGDVVLVR